MDLSTFAAALAFFSVLTFGVVDRVKAARPTLTATQVVLISVVVALAIPFVVAYSTFGNDIAVGSRQLNDLNVAALVVLGLLGAGGSSVIHQVVGSGGSKGSGGAVSSIGENQPPPE